MSALPFEVLTLIFDYLKTSEIPQRLFTRNNYLKTADLLQCQLTCKEWYQASADLLYSDIEISTSERSRLYGRTISNSTSLGARLKILDTKRLFITKKENELWDEHGLLNKLIRHCPNLLKMYSQAQDSSFWYRLTHAAS